MEIQNVVMTDRRESTELRPSRPMATPDAASSFFAVLSAKSDFNAQSLISPVASSEPPEFTSSHGAAHSVNGMSLSASPIFSETPDHATVLNSHRTEDVRGDRYDSSQKNHPERDSETAAHYASEVREETKTQESRDEKPAEKEQVSKKQNESDQRPETEVLGSVSGRGSRSVSYVEGESSVSGAQAKASTGRTAQTIESLIGSLVGSLRPPEDAARAKAATARTKDFHLAAEDIKLTEKGDNLAGKADSITARTGGAAPVAAISLQSNGKINDQKSDKKDSGAIAGHTGKAETQRVNLTEILGTAVDARVELREKPVLDSDKWNVISTKADRRESNRSEMKQDSGKGDSQKEFRNEPGMRLDLLRTAEKAASPQELEKGVRNGLNELVKKAHVQISSHGTATAQIRMNPEHLGFMSVDMKVEQNRVVLKILVDRPDVLEQLKKDLEILRTEFSKSGLQIDSVSLKLRESFGSAFHSDTNESEGMSFENSPDDQPEQRETSSESYFESAFIHPESDPVESRVLPADVNRDRGQVGYENQLVMNFHRSPDRTSFQA